MDLLERLLQHDAWTTRELLGRAAALSDRQLDQVFDLGLHTVRRSLAHIVRNVEVWTDLMREAPVRAGIAAPESIPQLLERQGAAAADLSKLALTISERKAWDDLWVDALDDPPRAMTYGGGVGHILTHSMHHRAQVIHMLRALGLADVPEGDLFSWENRRGRGLSGASD